MKFYVVMTFINDNFTFHLVLFFKLFVPVNQGLYFKVMMWYSPHNYVINLKTEENDCNSSTLGDEIY